MSNCGIYCISFNNGERFYFGSSIQLSKRWWQHQNHLKHGVHDNRFLQKCFDKWGLDAFEFYVIEICPKSELLVREQYYLDNHVLWGIDFNICRIAEQPPTNRKLTEEHKRKIGDANRGKIRSTLAKENQSKARIGKPPGNKGLPSPLRGIKRSPETVRKMSEALKGRKTSDDTRVRLSVSHKGQKSWNKGRTTTQEVKDKISNGVKRYWESLSYDVHMQLTKKMRLAKQLKPRREPECGHPERKHEARGLCRPCYRKLFESKNVARIIYPECSTEGLQHHA